MLLRSSPQSQRRLSDLMVGVDVGDVNVGLEGQLEDLLGPDAADMDRNPNGESSGQRTGTAGKRFCCAVSHPVSRSQEQCASSHGRMMTQKLEPHSSTVGLHRLFFCSIALGA